MHASPTVSSQRDHRLTGFVSLPSAGWVSLLQGREVLPQRQSSDAVICSYRAMLEEIQGRKQHKHRLFDPQKFASIFWPLEIEAQSFLSCLFSLDGGNRALVMGLS